MQHVVWNHLFVNMYKCMILDMLYQLLKEMIDGMHIFQSLKIIIRAKFKEACIKASIIKLLKQANGMLFLD